MAEGPSLWLFCVQTRRCSNNRSVRLERHIVPTSERESALTEIPSLEKSTAVEERPASILQIGSTAPNPLRSVNVGCGVGIRSSACFLR